jgi:hypothetical protein
MVVPHRKPARTSTACYEDTFTFLYVGDGRTSQETRTDLHGLLRGYLYFFICKSCWYLTGNTPLDFRSVAGIALLTAGAGAEKVGVRARTNILVTVPGQ